ncbi:MAG: hypothetical protein K2N07_11505, partial [Desulfovibrio sp.]|nr:hypothetical protein [Desulfovibrio sp.]
MLYHLCFLHLLERGRYIRRIAQFLQKIKGSVILLSWWCACAASVMPKLSVKNSLSGAGCVREKFSRSRSLVPSRREFFYSLTAP